MNFEVDDLQMLHAALDSFCNFLKERRVSDESIFDSRLVISELAGNVLTHSKEKAFIEGEIVNGSVEVEVCSVSCFCPPKTATLPDLYAEHGRGLYLVDKIGEKWFITPAGGIRVIIRTDYRDEKK